MLPLVDRDGLTKPVLQVIAEEALESGIEEIGVVVAPGDEAAYRRLLRNYAENLRAGFRGEPWAEAQARRLVEMEGRLRFAEQAEPRGYGHAVHCAKGLVGDEPFLLLLSDHVYILRREPAAVRQAIRSTWPRAEGCAVSAVQATREHLIHQYGTLAGRRQHDRPDVYAIDTILEKPNPTTAELQLHVPGPAGPGITCASLGCTC